MKRILFLLILFSFSSLFIACGQSKEMIDFDKSLQAWKVLQRDKKADHYEYTTSFSSFSGYGTTTSVEVKYNKVVSRSVKVWQRNGPNANVTKSFTENSSNLHSNPDGSKAKTMDELYQECQNEVLTKSPLKYKITFIVHSNGILRYCTYRPHNCQDDCTNGVNIERIKFL